MPVTFKVAEHIAALVSRNGVASADAILDGVKKDSRGQMIQSSFGKEIDPVVYPSRNGFVFSVAEAYNKHHHLVIRPDDIWLAITTQFSSYVNAHAEELREHLVAHEGQKTLQIVYNTCSRFTVDWADFATRINGLLEENITDPDLRQWITPQFSTSTQLDKTVAAIVMMGTLQAYFKYVAMVCCGIPSVTLLGEKEDYENILARLDKLCQYGDEPTQFREMLKPILQSFVRTFEEPEHAEVRDFWRRICDYSGGSGPDYYSGWITAFCFWGTSGRVQLRKEFVKEVGGHEYFVIDAGDIPSGFTKVPVHIIDHGEHIDAEMLAGSVGFALSSSGEEAAVNPYFEEPDLEVGPDTVQPQVGWFIYEKK